MNPLLLLPIDPHANPPPRDSVAQCAHELWAQADCPEGRDEFFWLEAEKRLSSVIEVPEISSGSAGLAGRLRKKRG
jgi:hypothetical protein